MECANRVRHRLLLWALSLRQRLNHSHALPPLAMARPPQPGWTRWVRGGRSDRDEDIPPALLHLVERPDVRHAALDVALRRACRHRRVRQPLFPYAWRQDRSDARVRAALGDL